MLRSGLVLAGSILAFLVVALAFVYFFQPSVKRLVGNVIDQLGGELSTAYVVGAAIGGAAFWSTWLAATKRRDQPWQARTAFVAPAVALVLLALGMGPQSRDFKYDRRLALEAVGDERIATLVGAATDAMILAVGAFALLLY